jgi:stage V sporulation protein D (sporulation-specific penicillin-binding protein)
MVRRQQSSSASHDIGIRSTWYLSLLLVVFAVIIVRMFYWQVIKGAELQAQAEDQYRRSLVKSGSRGRILTSEGNVLVANRTVYRAFAQPHIIDQDPQSLADQLYPLLLPSLRAYEAASSSAEQETVASTFRASLIAKLTKKDARWVSLATNVPEETKTRIAALRIAGLGFDAYETRSYPEGSMAAHVVGFVGKNEHGEDTGYFGVEGALDQELKGRNLETTIFADALGQALDAEKIIEATELDGRDVRLTIRRDLQNIAEQRLKQGMEQYGAQAGEIVIMEPATGKVLALAAAPSFEPRLFFRTDPALFQNPSLTKLYEPGSTFKLLTVSAGLDLGQITPDTECTACSGPRVFGKYTLRTWNDQYTPNISIRQGLAKSDNTAMIFVAEKVGADQMKSYVQSFGISEPLHIDLQGDRKTPLPQRWGPVELATISFGQGISTTSLQLVRAVGAIANHGVLMRPLIVESVTNTQSSTTNVTQPVEERQVISPATATTVTRMMIEAAQQGEAQWTASKTHTIAGKTGTSQVAASGGYLKDTTIASYVGFAPPSQPKFVMLVKLEGPTSSIWAAETAAPLWYQTVHDVFLALGIPPDREQ